MKRMNTSAKAKQEKQTAKLEKNIQKIKELWGWQTKPEEDCKANIKPENNFSPVKSLF